MDYDLSKFLKFKGEELKKNPVLKKVLLFEFRQSFTKSWKDFTTCINWKFCTETSSLKTSSSTNLAMSKLETLDWEEYSIFPIEPWVKKFRLFGIDLQNYCLDSRSMIIQSIFGLLGAFSMNWWNFRELCSEAAAKLKPFSKSSNFMEPPMSNLGLKSNNWDTSR